MNNSLATEQMVPKYAGFVQHPDPSPFPCRAAAQFNHALQRLPAILCLASLVAFPVLAAGEPKVPRTPAPLRDVLVALKPGMTGAEAKAVLATAYPKVTASLVRSGTNGYIWFHVDERYSVMISAQNPSSGDPSASSVILGPNVRAYYLTDRERKRATLTPR